MQTEEERSTSIWRKASSGAILLGIGFVIVAISWRYPFGSLTEMGPGFVPFYVGAAIAALGLGVLIVDLRTAVAEDSPTPHWRGLIFVCAAITLFATLINWVGLVPAMFLAVSVSMLADDQARPAGIIIYATVVTILGWLLFIQALGLPLSAFGR